METNLQKHLHALVDHLTLSLILQPGFCQVNGEDTCNANNASDSSINEFGREAGKINKQIHANLWQTVIAATMQTKAGHFCRTRTKQGKRKETQNYLIWCWDMISLKWRRKRSGVDLLRRLKRESAAKDEKIRPALSHSKTTLARSGRRIA